MGRQFSGRHFHPPDPALGDRVPPGQYLAKGFPVLSAGETPQIACDRDLDQWELRVWGAAEPVQLRWDDLMQLPQHDFTADFHCVTTWSKLDVQWRGIKIPDLLATLTIQPEAAHVMQHCYGGYTTNLTLDDFARPENFLAIALAGEPLPADHGGPLRSVIPHLYAWKSAKWLCGLEFLATEALGFWEERGYHPRGNPWARERFR